MGRPDHGEPSHAPRAGRCARRRVSGDNDEVRTAYGGGQIRFRGHENFLSQARKRQPVAVHFTSQDGVLLLACFHHPLGVLDLHPASGPVPHAHILDPEDRQRMSFAGGKASLFLMQEVRGYGAQSAKRFMNGPRRTNIFTTKHGRRNPSSRSRCGKVPAGSRFLRPSLIYD